MLSEKELFIIKDIANRESTTNISISGGELQTADEVKEQIEKLHDFKYRFNRYKDESFQILRFERKIKGPEEIYISTFDITFGLIGTEEEERLFFARSEAEEDEDNDEYIPDEVPSWDDSY